MLYCQFSGIASKKENTIEIDTHFALSNSFKQDSKVTVEQIGSITETALVMVEPVSVEDWEIIVHY